MIIDMLQQPKHTEAHGNRIESGCCGWRPSGWWVLVGYCIYSSLLYTSHRCRLSGIVWKVQLFQKFFATFHWEKLGSFGWQQQQWERENGEKGRKLTPLDALKVGWYVGINNDDDDGNVHVSVDVDVDVDVVGRDAVFLHKCVCVCGKL